MKAIGVILLMLIFVESQATSYFRQNACLNPPKPANGNVNVKSLKLGYKITWTCKDGFRLIGKSVTDCSPLKGLADRVPRCCPVCPEPKVPVNGGIASHGLCEEGVTVKFFCNDGFHLNGEEKLTCKRNNNDDDLEWNDDFPTCEAEEVTCPKPGVPKNGRIVGGDRSPFEVDDKIVYRCNEGFRLVGDDTLTCQSDGTFDSELPKCKEITCQSPRVPANGRVVGGDKAPFTVGEVVVYGCNKGFKLAGDNKITCQLNGKFDGGPPTCKRIMCQSLGVPENGRVVGGDKAPFTVGEVVVYGCNRGFKLAGDNKITCLSSGKFDGGLPTCKRNQILCQNPGVPDNGRVVGGDKAPFTVGEFVLYRCNKGFDMVGGSKITCQSNGKFDVRLPTCKKLQVPTSCLRPKVGPNVIIDPSKQHYPVGYKIKFRCSMPYYPIGGDRFYDICGKDGAWKNEKLQDFKCGLRY